MLYYNDEKTVVQIVFKVPKVLKQTGHFFFFVVILVNYIKTITISFVMRLHLDNYYLVKHNSTYEKKKEKIL